MVAPAKDTKTRKKTDEELMAQVREEIRIAEAQASTNGPRIESRIRRKIRVYERRYEMSSEVMMTCLQAGVIRETREISKWAFEWLLLKSLSGETPTTGTP